MMDLYFMGDSHGKWISFEDTITRNGISNAVVWNLGDGAFGFNQRMEDIYILSRLNNFCEKYNILLYNVRGNHDDPYWFKDETVLAKRLHMDDAHVGDWTKNDELYKQMYVEPNEFASIIKNLSHIKFVKDYDVVNINGLNILAIGGAISIDRSAKKRKGNYYPEEEIQYDKKVEKIKNVDIVASHIAPSFCEPTQFSDIVFDWAYYDRNLIDELNHERSMITTIYDNLMKNNTITSYFYGHYHQTFEKKMGGCIFRCLKPLEFHKYE